MYLGTPRQTERGAIVHGVASVATLSCHLNKDLSVLPGGGIFCSSNSECKQPEIEHAWGAQRTEGRGWDNVYQAERQERQTREVKEGWVRGQLVGLWLLF